MKNPNNQRIQPVDQKVQQAAKPGVKAIQNQLANKAGRAAGNVGGQRKARNRNIPRPPAGKAKPVTGNQNRPVAKPRGSVGMTRPGNPNQPDRGPNMVERMMARNVELNAPQQRNKPPRQKPVRQNVGRMNQNRTKGNY